jgi:hypothetical protein
MNGLESKVIQMENKKLSNVLFNRNSDNIALKSETFKLGRVMLTKEKQNI